MKNLLYLLLVLILFNACSKSQVQVQVKPSETNLITIEYLNPVMDYLVKVIWKPSNEKSNHITGPAIMEFRNIKDSTLFTITNNHFGILKNKLSFSYSNDSLKIEKTNNEIKLTYDDKLLFSEDSFGTTKEPFFFQDVDFDGNKELIIVEIENGQRFVSSFKAYRLENGDLQPDLYNITNEDPFRSFDERTKIDYKNKKITIYSSGGACSSSYYVYKFQPAKNEYEDNSITLSTIIDIQSDDTTNNCYELEYSVNQTKQLISKKLLTR